MHATSGCRELHLNQAQLARALRFQVFLYSAARKRMLNRMGPKSAIHNFTVRSSWLECTEVSSPQSHLTPPASVWQVKLLVERLPAGGDDDVDSNDSDADGSTTSRSAASSSAGGQQLQSFEVAPATVGEDCTYFDASALDLQPGTYRLTWTVERKISNRKVRVIPPYLE